MTSLRGVETTSCVQPFRLPHGAETTIVGNGSDISVFLPASLSGHFEPHLQKLFSRIVRPDWVCLDIGANIGLHSLYLASLAREVFAFEAAPSTFAHLSANRDLFKQASKLKLVHTALWDEQATLKIAVPIDLEGCAFIAMPEDDISSSFAKVSAANPYTLDGKQERIELAQIAAQRLDDWEATYPLDRLDLIKIDVEGSEPRVLAGAKRLLSHFDPCLITEYNIKCAASCFGSSPRLYFDVLRDHYDLIYVINDGGILSKPLGEWLELYELLSSGKFWTDLLCINCPLDFLLNG